MKNVFILRYPIIMLIMVITSCHNHRGDRGMSSSIGESIEKEVFVKQYVPDKNPIMINDIINLKVDEVWIEKIWFHDIPNKIEHNSGFQLIIKGHKNEKFKKDGINTQWTIGLNGDKYLRSCNENCLIGDFKLIPNDSVIIYKIKNNHYLNNYHDDFDKNIIGEIKLIEVSH